MKTERNTSGGSVDATDPRLRPRWRKSSASGPRGNCVELAALRCGQVGIRNSRDPQGLMLVLTREEFAAFLASIHAGELDDLAGDGAER